MTTIPILKGILATENADLQDALPVNLDVIIADSGVSSGYLRTADGVTQRATGQGPDRGAILWNNLLHRVSGTSLITVAPDGTVLVLGNIPGTGPARMDYGFGRLAINAQGGLYYWDGTSLVQVTDPDLGTVMDVCWIDGYYATTDGTSIIVTDLSDPTSVNPLKYGSAEADPDQVTGLMKIRGELIAFGRNTIEFFSNVGGSGFPFQVDKQATIQRGCVSPYAKAYFVQSVAFVGSGRNEALGVHLIGQGDALKISTRAIDDELAKVADPTQITVESRVLRNENKLLVHLPDRTLVYHGGASGTAGEAVWTVYRSGLGFDEAYRLRNAIYAYGDWWVGDTQSGAIGTLDLGTTRHFGEATGWRFQTPFLYNKANSFIVHSLELVGLPGRGGENQGIMLSTTADGETWSLERVNKAGAAGQRTKRVVWNPHRRFRNYCGLRFRGVNDGPFAVMALESDIEALNA